jgi:hypothetical protein
VDAYQDSLGSKRNPFRQIPPTLQW